MLKKQYDKRIKREDLIEILTISVTKDRKLIVEGQLSNKFICMHALADALKVVADYVPKKKKIKDIVPMKKPHIVLP